MNEVAYAECDFYKKQSKDIKVCPYAERQYSRDKFDV